MTANMRKIRHAPVERFEIIAERVALFDVGARGVVDAFGVVEVALEAVVACLLQRADVEGAVCEGACG